MAFNTNSKWSYNQKIMIIKCESHWKALKFYLWWVQKIELNKSERLNRSSIEMHSTAPLARWLCVSPVKMRRQSMAINFITRRIFGWSQACYVNFHALANVALGILCPSFLRSNGTHKRQMLCAILRLEKTKWIISSRRVDIRKLVFSNHHI